MENDKISHQNSDNDSSSLLSVENGEITINSGLTCRIEYYLRENGIIEIILISDPSARYVTLPSDSNRIVEHQISSPPEGQKWTLNLNIDCINAQQLSIVDFDNPDLNLNLNVITHHREKRR
ncbi:MAG: hypothetical protein RL208_236 [Pseudomonadota bacterium]|jgi:hypothetical protein